MTTPHRTLKLTMGSPAGTTTTKLAFCAQLAENGEHRPTRNGIDLSYTKWNKHGEKDEPSISAPKPVNATIEFVDT
ncbi:hypothetical protein Tco_1159615, partial [Tanacetum coccineum]